LQIKINFVYQSIFLDI